MVPTVTLNAILLALGPELFAKRMLKVKCLDA